MEVGRRRGEKDRSVKRYALLLVPGLLVSLTQVADAQSLQFAKPEAVGMSSPRLSQLDAAMHAEVDSGRKVGIVALVARRGKIAHFKAYGMAERESGTKMTTEHLFRLYSMTKPVTSVALLMLFEEGKFQLSDPLEKYIPAMKDLKVFAGTDAGGKMRLEQPKRKPTIHDVFRHTAGFAYGLIGQTPIDQLYRDNGIDFGRLASLKELVEDKLPKLPLLYHPANDGYIASRTTCRPIWWSCSRAWRSTSSVASASSSRLACATPCSVYRRRTSRATRPTISSRPEVARLARVETRDGRPPEGAPNRPLVYARFTTVPFGGLSLSSTAGDYALFGQMLVNGGELAGRRLLSPKTVELMTSNNLPPNIPEICCPPGLSPSGNGYGLGVSVLLDPALNGNLGSKGTFGWPGGASTFAILDPKEQMVLILMTQHAPADGDLAGRFQTLAYQAIVK